MNTEANNWGNTQEDDICMKTYDNALFKNEIINTSQKNNVISKSMYLKLLNF